MTKKAEPIEKIEELLPCPGCNNHFVCEVANPNTKHYRVDCDCGWTGPVKPTPEEARAAWNARKTPRISVEEKEALERCIFELDEINSEAVTAFNKERYRDIHTLNALLERIPEPPKDE